MSERLRGSKKAPRSQKTKSFEGSKPKRRKSARSSSDIFREENVALLHEKLAECAMSELDLFSCPM